MHVLIAAIVPARNVRDTISIGQKLKKDDIWVVHCDAEIK